MPTTQEFYAKLQDEMRKLEENLKGIKHRIVVFSGKGGVGKTMFSINLAYSILKHELCEQGKVGLLDADITTPNVPKLLGIKGELRAVKDNNGNGCTSIYTRRVGVKFKNLSIEQQSALYELILQ